MRIFDVHPILIQPPDQNAGRKVRLMIDCLSFSRRSGISPFCFRPAKRDAEIHLGHASADAAQDPRSGFPRGQHTERAEYLYQRLYAVHAREDPVPGPDHHPFTASGHQDPECINGYGNRSVFASGCPVFRQDPGIRPRICHIRAEIPMESASGEPFVI